MREIWSFCLILLLLFWGGEAQAGPLADRVAQFPAWDGKPPVQAVTTAADLVYPDWMAGTWRVTSTLIDLAAPLAPDVVTPGFESNRRYLNQPVSFQVRFQPALSPAPPSPLAAPFLTPLRTQNTATRKQATGIRTQDSLSTQHSRLSTQDSALSTQDSLRTQDSALSTLSPLSTQKVVGDRAFNGFNIAKAILGDRAVLSVKVDPDNPNRQITILPGERTLISIVTGRAVEMPGRDRFIATEISEQVFRGTNSFYLNEVETTTAYHRLQTPGVAIEADQITAVYLSPQDPNYFEARDQPVALYRYRLELLPDLATSK